METSKDLARELEVTRARIRTAATDNEALANAAIALAALAARITGAVEHAFLEIVEANAA